MSNYLLTLIALVALGIYFLPVLICAWRNHPQKNSIGIINIFVGWTLIGWVVALAWSCYNFEKKEKKDSGSR